MNVFLLYLPSLNETNMKKLLFAACLLLGACTGSDNDVCTRIDMVAAVEQSAQVTPLARWAKSVRFIPLETNDSILIKRINDVKVHGDKILVWHSRRLSLFDLNGKYLYDIGRQGGGPGEFTEVCNVWVDDRNVYLFDAEKYVKTYAWQGDFLSSVPVPRHMQAVFPLPDKDVLGGYISNLNGQEPTKMILFKGSTILDSIPYSRTFPKSEMIMVFYNEARAFSSGDRTAVKEMFNDTIYRFDRQLACRPYMVLDLGKYQPTAESRYTIRDPRISIFKGKVNLSVVGETDRYLFMTGRKSGKEHCYVYDKREKLASSIRWDYPEIQIELEDDAHFIPRTMSSDGKFLISYQDPANDDNPVVVMAEL